MCIWYKYILEFIWSRWKVATRRFCETPHLRSAHPRRNVGKDMSVIPPSGLNLLGSVRIGSLIWWARGVHVKRPKRGNWTLLERGVVRLDEVNRSTKEVAYAGFVQDLLEEFLFDFVEMNRGVAGAAWGELDNHLPEPNKMQMQDLQATCMHDEGDANAWATRVIIPRTPNPRKHSFMFFPREEQWTVIGCQLLSFWRLKTNFKPRFGQKTPQNALKMLKN